MSEVTHLGIRVVYNTCPVDLQGINGGIKSMPDTCHTDYVDFEPP